MTNNFSSRDTIAFTSSFSSTTYAYAADVGDTRRQVRIVPTVNQANATVKVNGTGVTSAMESGAIDLAFGANTITIEVTAQAGNTRNYTITVTRALPTVSVERSSYAFDEDDAAGFVRLFASQGNVMSGTVTWAPGSTHPADLATDVGTLPTTFTATASDTYPETFSISFTDDALNEEDETFTITLQPGTGYRVGSPATATITIGDNDPPAAPGSLSLTPGNTSLAASWQKPAGPVTQYQLRWKETSAADSLVTSGSDPADGWIVGSEIAATATTGEITSLTNDTGYDVQVRANDGQTATGNGWGAWSATQAGTPQGKTYGFTRDVGINVFPGLSANVDVTLSEAAPTGGLALTLTRLLGTNVPSGVCTGAGVTLAEAADIGSNLPTSVTVSHGQTTARVTFLPADNGDDLVRLDGGECFALRLGTTASGWLAGDAVLKVIIRRTSGNIAFGSSAASTAKHTATVAENVSGGTLSVPVTVDALPSESTGFAVEVLGAGTATENTDFSIASKTVTFGPQTAKTLNVEVTITDDVAVETDETIELRLVAGSGSLRDHYARHAQGSLAQITIQSEDALPGQVTGLSVSPGDAKLDVGWTAPSSAGSSAISGYDVHYTSSSTVAADAAVGTAVATEWVAVSRSGTAVTQEITGLVNDTPHRVRVRAVNGSGGGAWVVGTGTPSQAPAVTLAVAPNPVAEGSSVTVTATLSRALGSGVTIPLTLTDGTAEAEDHGTLASITVTGGQTSAEGTITTAQDTDADDETFTVALGTLPASVVAGTPNSVEVTITDDEKPTVSLAASPNPVAEGSPVTITATLTAALSTNVTIPLTLTDGSAEAGDHGTLASITVAAGQLSGTGTIATNHDAGEDDETFTVALGSPLPAAVLEGSPNSVEVRIVDDEGLPAVTLAASPNPVAEGSSVTITATLSKTASSSVTIPLTLTHGTAEDGDYATLASITVASGATSAEGTIRTNQDPDFNDETFTVALGTLPASVVAGTPNSVEVTITDDDRAAVTLEASPDPVDEGSSVTVTARLSKALRSPATIPLTVDPGTTEDGDIGSLASITVNAGRTSGTGVLSTVRDEDEEDETFTVALGSSLPSSVEAGDPSSVEITIRDDGPLRAELGLSTERPREGATVVLTATLNHPAPAGGVRVRFTADGAGDNPADPGIDYTLDPEGVGARETEWIGIAEGDMRAAARLRVVNDTEPEDDEAVAVGLVGSWASAEYVEKELTIPANDGGGGASAVAWIEAEPNPVDEGYDVTVTVRLSRALEEAATIPLTVRRGTSEEDDHGTLDEVVVAAGGDIASATIATSEDADSDDETFTVRLGSLPEGVRAGTPSSVQITIADPDKPDVWLEVEPVAVEEGERVTVTAVLAEALGRAVTIPVEVVRITSEQGDHGTLSSIRIASGRRDGRGRITTSRDADGEDETFAVVLGEKLPSGIGRGHPDSVEVVIVDAGAPADSEVSLSAAPDPVPEGERVTVTATLSEALARSVTIPVTVEPGTSEQGDHGTLSSIRIASGQTEGTGTVTTSVDEDTEDETFTVKLRDNLPAGVAAGAVPSVEVTIADRGGDVPGRVRSLRVTPGSGTLTLTWTAPSTGTVTAYDAWYKKRSESDWSGAYDDDYTDTSVEIAGLDNGTRYDVRVRGTNDHGAGPWATGSGTPTGGGGASGQLRSLTVTASATRDGTYAAATLSPTFRSSVTDYTATAATGTNFVKVRPTSADGRDVLVEGTLVKSGAESGPIGTNDGTVILISVFQGDGTPNHYVVKMSIPTASGDVARSVTAAVDAALAVVGELGVEDAAGALLGEKSLEEERLEALDRLGNANGRYDVGDLLSWIERCKSGGARCGKGPETPPPASDAALPGAVGAAVKRPRRRGAGRRRRAKPRRFRGLAVLLAAALWSCDGGGGPTAAIAPEPGTLAVEWTAQAGSPTVAGALVEIDGPGVGEVRAPGLELYESGEGDGPRRFVVAGALGDGPVIEFRVPDMRLAGLYTVRVVEVAGEDHRLLDAEDYRAGIASN